VQCPQLPFQKRFPQRRFRQMADWLHWRKGDTIRTLNLPLKADKETLLMAIDNAELLALPPEEKLRLVELLWDNLGEEPHPFPLPDWARDQALRRRDEMRADPSLGLTHEETWRRIEERGDG